MASTANTGHVSRALDFFDRTDQYFCIGQTSAWVDENNPPAPDVTLRDVNQIIGYKKVENKYMVVPMSQIPNWAASTAYTLNKVVFPTTQNGFYYLSTTAGNSAAAQPTWPTTAGATVTDGTVVWTAYTKTQIDYQASSWIVMQYAQALYQGARWVYIDATLKYDEIPLTSYRQIGVYSRLALANGVSAGTLALTPAQVSSTGFLEVLENRKAVGRAIDQKELLSLVIEF